MIEKAGYSVMSQDIEMTGTAREGIGRDTMKRITEQGKMVTVIREIETGKNKKSTTRDMSENGTDTKEIMWRDRQRKR